MKLISNIDVRHGHNVHRIGLYHGDLTEIPPEHAVDILIVSAFPDDYTPNPQFADRCVGSRGAIDLNTFREQGLRFAVNERVLAFATA